MTTLEKVAEIEDTIDGLLEAYFRAEKEHNGTMMEQAVECIEHEMKKLRDLGWGGEEIQLYTRDLTKFESEVSH